MSIGTTEDTETAQIGPLSLCPLFLCQKGVITMFKDQLEEWCERNGQPVPTKKKTPKKRKKSGKKREKLAFNDIKGLMGMDRATYGRKKGGAITQR